MKRIDKIEMAKMIENLQLQINDNILYSLGLFDEYGEYKGCLETYE